MSYESGPDETLSPDEAYAWSVIERSLRRELPLHRIERSARLRSDRAILAASLGLIAGLGLAVLAGSSPTALIALGMMLAGACLGVIVVRALLSVVLASRSYRPAVHRRRFSH